MQSPVTKGLLITVSALVAAGIAVYESPQFRQWVDNSRRKLAQTLHHLGDEIHPPSSSPRETEATSQDISMTEDTSEAAEERRRAIREELERRSAALAAKRRKSEGGSVSSFNDIVDKQGRLLDLDDDDANASTNADEKNVDTAGSTGVDLGLSSQVVQRGSTSGRYSPESDTLDMPGTPGTPDTPDAPGTPAASASSYTDANSFAELDSRASTPSTLSEFSHVHRGEVRSGTVTPADWSEVGSEISNEESRYY